MERRQVVRFLGAAFALPFLPRSADAAIRLGEDIHRRILEEGEVPFRTFNAEQMALVSDIAEAIIPATDTPGARAMKVPEFIDLIMTEWAGTEEKTRFLDGLADIDARAGGKYVDLPASAKTALVTELDKQRDENNSAGRAFGRLKRLTVYGYFTSKAVDEQVLKTRMYFDSYQGNVPFTPGV